MHFLQKARTEQKTRQLANTKKTQDREAKKAISEVKEAAKVAEKKKPRSPTKSSNTISPMPSPTRKKLRRDTRLHNKVQLAVQYTVLKEKIVADISRLQRMKQQLEETKRNLASTQDHFHYTLVG